MRKLKIPAVAALFAILVAAPSTSAATRTHSRRAHGAPLTYEAVAGRTKTAAEADSMLARVQHAGFKDFVIERDAGTFEVERPLSTLKVAQSEHGALHRAGFRFAFIE